jgi:hypothetical protein
MRGHLCERAQGAGAPLLPWSNGQRAVKADGSARYAPKFNALTTAQQQAVGNFLRSR